MLNEGYLKAKRTPESDLVFTPAYAVKPLLKYIKPNSTIWCPFDTSDSEFVKIFCAGGHKVIQSHIDEGKDFFDYEPEEYEVIISNPPYSTKDKVLKRLYELDKPFAMLLPLPTLQGQKRFDYLVNCQALIFDKRINFYMDLETKKIKKGISFATFYLCKNFLPKDLIFEKIQIE